MFVFVASVHHTGTQFTQKLFEDLGYVVTDKTPKEAGNSVNYFHRCHITDAVRTELTEWLAIDVPLIVPLRHPVEVAKSWKIRKKKLSVMLRQWQLLDELVIPHKPLFLPVDHDDRDRYFTNLKLKTDLALNTDWAKVSSKRKGSDHRAQLVVPDFDPDDICDVLPLTGMDWLTDIYPEPWLLMNGETAE